jgi:hypothetical protein
MGESRAMARRRIVTYAQMKADGLPYSMRQLERLERRGLFPPRIKPTPTQQGRCFWAEDEVDAWWDERFADRPTAPATEPLEASPATDDSAGANGTSPVALARPARRGRQRRRLEPVPAEAGS